MTDEQFNLLMQKLEELKVARAPNQLGQHPGQLGYPQPMTQPGQYWDHYPPSWHIQTRD